jgi:carbamate kinase
MSMGRHPDIPGRFHVAIGGNATHPPGILGTPEDQGAIAHATGCALLPLMELNNELVITHGNGPVVGKILMCQILARDRVTPMSMDICVAHSQGRIAYPLMQALENTLREAGNPHHVACLLTQVEVDPGDPAFQNPTKPIGYFYTEEEAQELKKQMGWEMQEDANRGWRHVVPSLEPKHIADTSLVRTVIEGGAVCIAGGGGGIPVVRSARGTREGVESVIDKDLTSALMGNVLRIEHMMILTSVSSVAIYFGTDKERELDKISLSELRIYQPKDTSRREAWGPRSKLPSAFSRGVGNMSLLPNWKRRSPPYMAKRVRTLQKNERAPK